MDVFKPYYNQEEIVIFDFLLSVYPEADWANRLTSWLFKKYVDGKHLSEQEASVISSRIRYLVSDVKGIMASIESHMGFLMSVNSDPDANEEMAEGLCKDTLVYHLASEGERSKFVELFKLVVAKLEENSEYLSYEKQAKTMSGIDKLLLISEWLEQSAAQLENETIEGLFVGLLPLYKKLNEANYDDAVYIDAFNMWIAGAPLHEISKVLIKKHALKRTNILHIEKLCRDGLSYNMAFLIGNIIDVLEDADENVVNRLKQIQKRIKYGINSNNAITVYEAGIADRIISQQIADILGDDDIPEDAIADAIISQRSAIENILKDYPTFFSDELDRICR